MIWQTDDPNDFRLTPWAQGALRAIKVFALFAAWGAACYVVLGNPHAWFNG